MSEQGVQAREKQNLISTPPQIVTQDEEQPTLPTELALAILYIQAKRLKEVEALAQILTGHTPKGEPVTYIKLIGIKVDPVKGFVLAGKEPTAEALAIQPGSVGNDH